MKISIPKFSRDAKLFLFGNFINGFGITGFNLLFNLYLKSKGIGEGSIGRLLSVGAYSTMLMVLPASFLIRKFSLKKIFTFTVLFLISGYLLAVISASLKSIFIGMIISGMCSAIFSCVGGPLIMEVSGPEERTLLFSFNFAISLSASIFGNILAGNLSVILNRFNITQEIALKFAIIIHLFIASFSLIPFLSIRDARIFDEEENIFKMHTKIGLILKLSTPHLLVGFGAGLSIPFLNLYFRDRFSLSTSTIGYFFSISQLTMIFGTLIAPFISKHKGKIITIVLSQIFSVPFLFILSVTNNLPIAFISFILRSSLMNMAQPIVTNFSLEMVDKNTRPFLSGLLTIAWISGWGLSANIGGKIIESKGYSLPFNLTGIFYIISSILYLRLLLPLEISREKNKK
uniref:MFS transporter n=1 Tax=candidate division WOR-3 bacterium TaxID=2052148 RepID=A0A7C4UFW5_UNCW3